MFFLIVIIQLFFCMGARSCDEPHHTTAFISLPFTSNTLLTYSQYTTDHFWNKESKKFPTYNHFRERAFLFYSEYSFSDFHSFFVHGGYSAVSESMNGGSHAVHDLDIGVKNLLMESPDSAATCEVLFHIPTGRKKSSIRWGKFAIEASLLYSKFWNLNDLFLWIDTGLGYRVYQGFPSDEIRGFFAIGKELLSWFAIIATNEVEYGFSNGSAHGNLNNITMHPKHRLYKGKLEGVVNIVDMISISVGGYKHFWGQNVGAGGGFFCGTWINI